MRKKLRPLTALSALILIASCAQEQVDPHEYVFSCDERRPCIDGWMCSPIDSLCHEIAGYALCDGDEDCSRNHQCVETPDPLRPRICLPVPDAVLGGPPPDGWVSKERDADTDREDTGATVEEDTGAQADPGSADAGREAETGSSAATDSGEHEDRGTVPGTDTGKEPATDPGSDPDTGTEPATDPGSDPDTGTEPATDPGSDPDTGTEPATDAGTDTAVQDCSTPELCDDGDPCTGDTCVPGVGCVHGPAREGTACDDGDACTTGEACNAAGTCAGGRQVDCDDSNPCSLDTCHPAIGCRRAPAPEDTPCYDGDACTLQDVCDGLGECEGAMRSCDDGDACTVDSCNPAWGCTHSSAEEGTPCDDGDACTENDSCNGSGRCRRSTQVVCDDGRACTTDACNPQTGCIFGALPRGWSCEDGDACTEGDACDGEGSCVGETRDCEDGDPCTINSCVPTHGCTATRAGDGDPCDDGDECTEEDSCDEEGACQGAPVDCDDLDPCTLDACHHAAGCVHGFAPAQTSCDDGDACTTRDVCDGEGGCGGRPRSCDDGTPCTEDSCDSTDGCVFTPTAGGESGPECSDGSICTTGDACDGEGACAGSLVDCDDGNECTEDSCDPSIGCVHEALGSELACEDGDPCTADDACDGNGACTGEPACACAEDDDCDDDGLRCNGLPRCVVQADMTRRCETDPATIVTCPTDGDTACSKSRCAEPTGACEMVAEPAGSACDDGDACTYEDECSAGECAGRLIACSDGDPCTDDECDPETGCTFPFADATTSCDDGVPCTVGDRCDGLGGCAGVDTCPCASHGDCEDDGDLCNGVLACRELGNGRRACELVQESVVDCDTTGDSECSQTVCVPQSGLCVEQHASSDAECDDDNACTEDDTCDGAGGCTGSTMRCDDGNACTIDACDPAAGCTFTPVTNGISCHDGDYCTLYDTCQDGVCQPGVPKDCDDQNSCTTEYCNHRGACVYSGRDGVACDDGDPCTDGDACTGQGDCEGTPSCECTYDSDCEDDNNHCNGRPHCVEQDDGTRLCEIDPSTVVVCSTAADTECKKAQCNPLSANCEMKNMAFGTQCSDGDDCTEGDRCEYGSCEPGESISCDDGNECTTDACDPSAGCTFTTRTGSCDDGNFCTVGDYCQSGVCQPGTGSPDCDDGNVCTDDRCSGGECKHTNNEATCSDWSACTVGDRCAGGVCRSGSARECDDGNPCTADSCNPLLGCVNTAVAEDSPCPQDGDPCTWDVCRSGQCTHVARSGEVFGEAGSLDAVLQLPDGGLAMAGTTSSKGAGMDDFWLVRLDGSGAQLWDQTYGGSANDWARDLVVDSYNRFVIVGTTYSDGAGGADGLVVRASSEGAQTYEYTAGSSGEDFVKAAAVPDLTDVVLAGHTDSAGSGGEDVWLTRRSSTGGVIWDYTFGGTSNDKGLALLDLPDGGLMVAGETNSKGKGLNDMWLLRLSSNGAKQWEKTYGTTKGEAANAIAMSPHGHVLLAGFTGDGPSFFNPTVVRADSAGNKQAQHTIAGSVIELVTSLVLLEGGDYVVAGGSRAMGIGNTDIRVTRISPSGTVAWDRGFGSSGPDTAYDLVVTEEGGLAVVGSVDSQAAWLMLNSDGEQCGD